MKILRRIVVTLASIAVLTFAVRQFHRYDVCISEFRIVSISEIIDAAIAVQLPYLAREGAKDDFGAGTRIPEGSRILTNYRDVADFKARNPDCCKIIKNPRDSGVYGGSWISELDWFFGSIGSVVVLDHVTEIATPSGQTMRVRRKQEVPISSCGRKEVEFFRTPLRDGELL